MKNHQPVISIGEAAKLTELSDSALRKYEKYGLIVFHRTVGNRRMVSFEDINRIKIIRALVKEKGLTLEGILRIWALIPCWKIQGCSTEEIEKCPVISQSLRPCWVIMRFTGCTKTPTCADCEVYRHSANVTENIKPLLLHRSNVSE